MNLSRGFFALTIILAPFRYRIVLQERPAPPVYHDFTDYLLFPSNITLVITLLLWGVTLYRDRRRIKFGAAHIWIPLYGLTLAGWLSTVTSKYRELSAYHVLLFVLLFGFYLFIVNEVKSMKWIVIPLAIQLLLQTSIALGQSVYQRSLGLVKAGELELDPAVAGVSIVFGQGIRFLRAYGLTDHPNILGGFMAIGLLLLMATFIQGQKHNLWLILILFIYSSVLAALALSFSRSAWLALLAGGLLIFIGEWVIHERKRVGRMLLLVMISALTLSPVILINKPYFRARLGVSNSYETNPMERQALDSRMLLVRSANRIFVEHPINGIGLAASPLAMKDYYPDYPINYQPPHFTFLVVAVETGIFGSGFYLMLLALPWIALLMYRKKIRTHPYLLAFAAMLLALEMISLFDYYPWLYNSGRFLQWLVWGLWSSEVSTL